MSWLTFRDPETGDQQGVDEATLAPPADAPEGWAHAYAGWDLVATSDGPTPEDGEIVDGEWIVPLGVLQDRKWAEAKAIRMAKENGTAPTPLGPVQIDEPSKAKIMGVLAMARLVEETGGTFAEQFTMADNSVAALDSVSVRQLAGAAGQYVSAVYAHARTVRAAIYAEGVTAEELARIDVEEGWPE